MRRHLLLFVLLLSILAVPAAGVLVDAGLVNETAPEDDPGWAHVGTFGLNGVYVGYGWVLTAAHVPVSGGGVLSLDGVNYPVVPASRVVFQHEPGRNADLAAFRIDPYPAHLPVLPLRATIPVEDMEAVMIGRGREQTTANAWGPGGWNWSGGNGPKRWGNNFVGGDVAFWPGTSVSIPMAFGANTTQSIVLEFNDVLNPAFDPDPDPGLWQPVSDEEAVIALGDSGSGLFLRNDISGEWELAGIAWLVTTMNGQPASTSIYGNDSLYSDVSHYRDDVMAVVRPCADGIDNDGDGGIDLADNDCLWAGDMSELPACADGLDNDFDGSTDLVDGDCTGINDLLEAPDQDGDLWADAEDNCTALANPAQSDGDQDGYGTLCDADFSNDGVVGTPDFNLSIVQIGSVAGMPGWEEAYDITGDGAVGLADFFLMIGALGDSPGPSGLSCAGTVPCP